MYATSNYMHVQGCRSLGHNQLLGQSISPAPLRQLLPGHKGFVLNVAAHVLCGGSLRVARGCPVPGFSKISGKISVGGSSRKISRICSAGRGKSVIFVCVFREFLLIFGECGILALGN